MNMQSNETAPAANSAQQTLQTTQTRDRSTSDLSGQQIEKETNKTPTKTDVIQRGKLLDDIISKRPISSTGPLPQQVVRSKIIDASKEKIKKSGDEGKLKELRQMDDKLAMFIAKAREKESQEKQKMLPRQAKSAVNMMPNAAPPPINAGTAVNAAPPPHTVHPPAPSGPAMRPPPGFVEKQPVRPSHSLVTSKQQMMASTLHALKISVNDLPPTVRNRIAASASSSPTTNEPKYSLMSAYVTKPHHNLPVFPSNDSLPKSLAPSGSFSTMKSQSEEFDDGADLPDLPLENKWQWHYDRRGLTSKGDTHGKNYENNLLSLGTFDTIKTFWAYFNNLKQPSGVEMNGNLHLFKYGIKPMWEDPANQKGGKWTINFNNEFQLIDDCWTSLCLALVGETIDPEDQICGAVFSKRTKGDRISVWVRDYNNLDALFDIGKGLLQYLNIVDANITLDFTRHSDSIQTGTSYNVKSINSKIQLTLESLREAVKKGYESRRQSLEALNAKK